MEAEDTCGAAAAAVLVAEGVVDPTGEAIPEVARIFSPGTHLQTRVAVAAGVGTTATRRRRITTARSTLAGAHRGTRNGQGEEDSRGPAATEMVWIVALMTANGPDTR